MSSHTRFPHYVLDDDGLLVSEIACVSCRYILRGLPPGGACPECGAAVKKSLRGDSLHYCDPVWLKQVATGVDILLAGSAFFVLGGFLLIGMAESDSVPYFAKSPLRLGPAVLPLLGIWRATMPESPDAPDTLRLSARKLPRVAIA